MKLAIALGIVVVGVGAYFLWPMPEVSGTAEEKVEAQVLPTGKQETNTVKQGEENALPHLGKAPELTGLTNWTNSEEIRSMDELRGKVVLVDFWTFACINCIRTLPHVEALYNKYKDDGFVVLGLHAPEFSYEHKIENVRAAVQKHGLTYPIAQDNDFQTWRAYNNRYWPAHYLIDKEGNVRYTHFGEGAYQEMDDNVALLLAE